MNKLFFFALLNVMVSCHPNKNEPIDVDQLKFKTTDGSEIYFNNVRRSEYSVENMKEAGIDIYQPQSTHSHGLSIKIIYNWRHDQAFLALSTVETLVSKIYYQPLKSKQKVISLEPDRSFIDQTKSAIEIYNAILLDQPLYLDEGLTVGTTFDKKQFRVTCFDFLKLTENR